MTWEEIYNELDLFKPRMEYVIGEIAKICTQTTTDKRGKSLQLLWVCDVKNVPTKRWLKEVVSINNEQISRMHIGVGYYGNCFYERTYCEKTGVKYNFSEWKLININQLETK